MLLTSADTAAQGVPTFDVAGATGEFIEANPDFLETWTRAQDWAVQQLLDSPDDASVGLAVQLGITPEQAHTQAEGLQFLRASEQASSEYLGGGLAEDLQANAEFLLSQGEITGVSDPEVYRDGVYVDAAKAVAGP